MWLTVEVQNKNASLYIRFIKFKHDLVKLVKDLVQIQ